MAFITSTSTQTSNRIKKYKRKIVIFLGGLFVPKATLLHYLFLILHFKGLHLLYQNPTRATIFAQHERTEMLSFSDHMECDLMEDFNASVTFLQFCCEFIIVLLTVCPNEKKFIFYSFLCHQKCFHFSQQGLEPFNQTADQTKEQC